jgi:hypothetical protein
MTASSHILSNSLFRSFLMQLKALVNRALINKIFFPNVGVYVRTFLSELHAVTPILIWHIHSYNYFLLTMARVSYHAN